MLLNDSISGVVSAKYQIVTDDQSVSDDEGAWNELDESGIDVYKRQSIH